MDLIRRLEGLVETFETLSIDNQVHADKITEYNWTQGYFSSRASAYKMSGEWLKEILATEKRYQELQEQVVGAVINS